MPDPDLSRLRLVVRLLTRVVIPSLALFSALAWALWAITGTTGLKSFQIGLGATLLLVVIDLWCFAALKLSDDHRSR